MSALGQPRSGRADHRTAASPSAASAVGRLTLSLQVRTSRAVRGPQHLGVARKSSRGFKKRAAQALTLESEQSPLLHQLGVQEPPGQVGGNDQSGSAG